MAEALRPSCFVRKVNFSIGLIGVSSSLGVGLNKSFLTNVSALALIAVSYFSPVYQRQLFATGFFAFSGAFTNWLAIYMLFEKVPFLYGSGVIPSQFQEFKSGIKELIMTQFFTDENVDRFFQGQQDSAVSKMNFEPVIEAIDYDQVFKAFIADLNRSAIGEILKPVGGLKFLKILKRPFKKKVKTSLKEISKSPQFLKALEDNILPSNMSSEVVAKVEDIVDVRLNELTPQMVKEIIQGMIQKHLGWLVVWGGVFGGLIGLLMTFVSPGMLKF